MSLLLNTDIESKVNSLLYGKIARIGGRMNQLFKYKNCSITDINVIDGGYGKVRSGFDFKASKRKIRQEISWMMHGEREQRDRKTILLDMHYAMREEKLHQKFDAAISSNVIEHSPNPIFLLLNIFFITKENGWQFHAIPNYRYTFDEFRKPTPVDHMIEDFEKKIWFSDTTHNADYTQSAIEKNGWQKAFHEKYPVAYPYMHFHVFDENNVRELAEFMFEEVIVDLLKDEKHADNLLLVKNKLRPEFAEKYLPRMSDYKIL